MALARPTLDAVFPGRSCSCGVVKRRAAPMTPPLKEMIVTRNELLAAIRLKETELDRVLTQYANHLPEAQAWARSKYGTHHRVMAGHFSASCMAEASRLRTDINALNVTLSAL